MHFSPWPGGRVWKTNARIEWKRNGPRWRNDRKLGARRPKSASFPSAGARKARGSAPAMAQAYHARRGCVLSLGPSFAFGLAPLTWDLTLRPFATWTPSSAPGGVGCLHLGVSQREAQLPRALLLSAAAARQRRPWEKQRRGGCVACGFWCFCGAWDKPNGVKEKEEPGGRTRLFGRLSCPAGSVDYRSCCQLPSLHPPKPSEIRDFQGVFKMQLN